MTYTTDDLNRIGKIIPQPFIMPYYDRNSLKEIKKLIESRAYKDRKTVEQHMLFLEHLSDKLQNILRNEQGEGESALMLKRDLDDVRATFAILSNLLDSMP